MQFIAAPRLNETSQTGKWERTKPEISPKNKNTIGCSTNWMQSGEHPIRASASHGALAIPMGDAGAPWDAATLERMHKGGMHEGKVPSSEGKLQPC